MAKVKLGSNTSYSGNQKGLTIVGGHCYAFSGTQTVQASVTVLSFTTGKYYIVGVLDSFMGEGDTNFQETIMTYNGAEILNDFIEHSSGAHNSTRVPIHIVIPPMTAVTVALRFGASTDSASAQITGRVYDA